MKKILAIALCVVLCFCMAVPAFAAGTVADEYTGQNEKQDVRITINGDIVHVYLVEIEYNNPTFTYKSGSKWNPGTYQYEPSATATWAGTGTVKITNHSDLPINYTVEGALTTNDYGPLEIKVTDGTKQIEKCNAGDVRGSHNATATYVVDGKPTVSEITEQKLGEITVTIARVN